MAHLAGQPYDFPLLLRATSLDSSAKYPTKYSLLVTGSMELTTAEENTGFRVSER